MIRTTNRRKSSRSRSGPVEFTVSCLCGREIQGTRQSECQVLTCPDCRAGVFVLGESPLSAIDPPPESPPPRPAIVDPRRVERRAQAKRRLRRRKLRHRWKSFLRPFRSLRFLWSLPSLVSIVLVAILFWTAQSQWQAYRERRQIEKIEQAGRDGLEAIERGDFERADRLFEPIRHLLDINAPGDQQQYAVAARESHILANLLLDSIDRKMTLVAEANERDRESLLGQGVLFDGVVLLPDVGDASLDVRFFVNDRPVRVLLGSKEELRSAGIEEKGRYLIGVKLRSLERSGEEWILQVHPASTIAITRESALPALGLGDAPELFEIVRQQQALRKKRLTGAEP